MMTKSTETQQAFHQEYSVLSTWGKEPQLPLGRGATGIPHKLKHKDQEACWDWTHSVLFHTHIQRELPGPFMKGQALTQKNTAEFSNPNCLYPKAWHVQFPECMISMCDPEHPYVCNVGSIWAYPIYEHLGF